MCSENIHTCACGTLLERKVKRCRSDGNPDIHTIETRVVQDLTEDCEQCQQDACPLPPQRCLPAGIPAVRAVGGCRHTLYEYGKCTMTRDDAWGDLEYYHSVIEMGSLLCDGCRAERNRAETESEGRARIRRLAQSDEGVCRGEDGKWAGT